MLYRLKVCVARWLFRVWERLMVPTLLGRATAQADVYWLSQIIWLTRCLHIATELRIADHLVHGPKSIGELARLAAADEQYLFRVLRLLAAFEIFAIDEQRQVTLTARAESLRSDSPQSLRDWIMHGAQVEWELASALPQAVNAGRPVDRVLWNQGYWEFLADHPELQSQFIAGMDRWNDAHIREFLLAFDLSSFGRVVDVGGGRGALIIGILQHYPALHGILYDRPPTIEQAAGQISAAKVADGCEAIGGSFLESVPSGGDLYLLKHVLHDWDDERAVQILRNTAQAMSPTAPLLVIQGVLDPANGADRLLKLNDLVYSSTSGRMRTLPEFEHLFQRAGLRLDQVITTRIPDLSILVVRRVS